MAEYGRAPPRVVGGRGPSYSVTASQDDEEDGVFIAPVGSLEKISHRSAGIRGNFHSPHLPASRPRRRRWVKYNIMNCIRPSSWNAFWGADADSIELDPTFRHYKERRQRIMLGLAVFFVAFVILVVLVTGGEELKKRQASSSSIISHGAYQVVDKAAIAEIQADMVLYRHVKTEAQILSIIPNDASQDSVFGASIKTVAEDNRGSAHVVMQAIWDGSEKYPLKDPVHEYRKGSLATHLSATCLEDRTVFAAASRNRADFKNLVNILMDAIYAPKMMTKEDQAWIFREEAWRLDPKDRATFTSDNPDLEFNGVVLNEQKAVYVDPDQMMERLARRALYPDTNYQYDAQGVPDAIFNLEIKDMQGFYKKHYAATNTQLFFYGPVDHVRDGLDAFDLYVKNHQKRMDKLASSIPEWQPLNMKTPTEEIHSYPLAVDQDGGYDILTSWLVNEAQLDMKTEFAWQMIDYLLLGTPNSVMRMGLEDELALKEEEYVNGTIRAIEVVGGLETLYQQWRFSIGIKGVSPDKVDVLQQSIIDRLNAIKSFDADAVKAALNVVELNRRDLSSGNHPRGVKLLNQVLPRWSYYRLDPKDAMAFEPALSELEKEIQKNGDKFLVDLLHTKLVNNTHRVNIQLFGEKGQISKQEKAERDRLALMRETLSDQDLNGVLQESVTLMDAIDNSDAPGIYDMLPRLDVADLSPLNAKRTAHLSINHNVLSAQTVVPSSFGMFYVDFGVDLQGVAWNDAAALPLIFRLMLEAGTAKWSSSELINQIGFYSSGIAAEYMLLDVRQKDYSGPLQFSVHDGIHLATKAVFRGRCTEDNLSDYLLLLSEIIFYGRTFEKNDVVEVLNRMIEEMEEDVEQKGHEYARRRLDARYSYQGMAEEVLNGYHQLMYLHNTLIVAVVDFSRVEEQLSRAQKAIVQGHRNGMFLSITGEEGPLGNAKSTIDRFLADGIPVNKDNPFSAPGEQPHPWIPQMQATKNDIAPFTDEALLSATEVNYVGKGGKLFEAGTAVDGSAAVVAKYLEQSYLYRELRLKRGADNDFVKFNFRHGTLILLSDRDPHLTSTLRVFDNAGAILNAAIADELALPVGAHQAIVGTIADWDGTAKQPDQIGWDFVEAFFRDDNADFEQQWREQILNATRDDFASFVVSFKDWKSPSIAIVTNVDAYTKFKNETADSIGFHAVCAHYYCPGLAPGEK